MKKSKTRVVAKRKPGARSKAPSSKFSPGEYVRIVPLHYPKPSMSIDELGRLRGEPADTDPFDGQPHVAPASAHLTYNNGALLTSVQVFTIFWGAKWGAATGSPMMQNLNKFFQAIVGSPLMTQLQEYSVPGQSIGPGSFLGTKLITANAPVGSVTDSTIRKQLQAWIASKTVPKNTKNSLYFVYLEPGIVSIMGGRGRLVRQRQWGDRRHLRLELQEGRRVHRADGVVERPEQVRVTARGQLLPSARG
jgi:hypothetical protein